MASGLKRLCASNTKQVCVCVRAIVVSLSNRMRMLGATVGMQALIIEIRIMSVSLIRVSKRLWALVTLVSVHNLRVFETQRN